MITKTLMQRTILTLTVLLVTAITALAQHDQQMGSLLIYNYVTSDASQPSAQNTKISLTNTSSTDVSASNLFLINGATGLVAKELNLVIVPRGTITLMASDIAPGVTGWMFVSGLKQTGVDKMDSLIGSAAITLASGHYCTLPAVAYRATDSLKTSKLMMDMLPSPLADQRPLLVVNNLNQAVSLSGIIRGSHGNGTFSLPLGGFNRQITRMLDDSFSVTPLLSTLIPTTQYFGWMEINGNRNGAGVAPSISGAVLYFSPNTGISPGAFTGGYNLRHVVTP
jgi:hypothetical protein